MSVRDEAVSGKPGGGARGAVPVEPAEQEGREDAAEPEGPEGRAEEPGEEAPDSDAADGAGDEADDELDGEPEGPGAGEARRGPRKGAAGAEASRVARLLADKRVQFVLGFVLPAIVAISQMWRVRSFTIDDAYISYRYARNLANGLGLVYNAGERIEGYTNFLFTVLLAGGIELGIDPDLFAKLLGGGSAIGALFLTYKIAERFRPYDLAPCVATWLMATSIVFSGYAVFGLETSTFVFLVLLGLYLFFRETTDQEGKGFPVSGLVFALAGLTRPEAPMFLGIPMLLLGRRFFSRQNILRGLCFAAVVGAHLLFRKAYYGDFLPNTLSAKTGDLDGQLQAGFRYVTDYVAHAGPAIWLALFGAALGVESRRREILTVAVLALASAGYVTLVGGDWMPRFRFMSPFEPLAFLLVDLGVRTIVGARSFAGNLAVAAFGVFVFFSRVETLKADQKHIKGEERFWDMAAGGTAKWLLDNGVPGEIAIGDIGYVGYATDYPLLDLLGLVDPVISKLPGGYTRKLGPGFRERFFDKAPTYALIISANTNCRQPSVPGSQVLYRDPRFLKLYEVGGKVPLDRGFAWCIYRRKDAPKR